MYLTKYICGVHKRKLRGFTWRIYRYTYYTLLVRLWGLTKENFPLRLFNNNESPLAIAILISYTRKHTHLQIYTCLPIYAKFQYLICLVLSR